MRNLVVSWPISLQRSTLVVRGGGCCCLRQLLLPELLHLPIPAYDHNLVVHRAQHKRGGMRPAAPERQVGGRAERRSEDHQGGEAVYMQLEDGPHIRREDIGCVIEVQPEPIKGVLPTQGDDWGYEGEAARAAIFSRVTVIRVRRAPTRQGAGYMCRRGRLYTHLRPRPGHATRGRQHGGERV